MDNYERISGEVTAAGARLVAVSKTKPVAMIRALYDRGQRIFGENRALELRDKQPELPDDIQWHMIGHLQTNKVKYIAPFVAMIHSIDSFKVLEEVNKQADRNDRMIDCLLQFKVAREEEKYGFDRASAKAMLEAPEFAALQNVRICGVMGMATFTDDMDVVREEFKNLKAIFEELKTSFFQGADAFREISMGMSGDYETALEEGSTMVRIGTLLFGERG